MIFKIFLGILVLIVVSLAVIYMMKSTNSSTKDPIHAEAQVHYKRGLKHLEKRQYEQALERFNMSLELEDNEVVRKARKKAMSYIGPI